MTSMKTTHSAFWFFPCFWVLSMATATPTCKYKGESWFLQSYSCCLHTDPSKTLQITETYLKTESKTACTVHSSCKEFLPVLFSMKSIIIVVWLQINILLWFAYLTSDGSAIFHNKEALSENKRQKT